MVGEGVGLMLGAAYIFRAPPPGIATRPIVDMDPLLVHMFTRSGESDALVLEFMEMLAEEARRTQVTLDAG